MKNSNSVTIREAQRTFVCVDMDDDQRTRRTTATTTLINELFAGDDCKTNIFGKQKKFHGLFRKWKKQMTQNWLSSGKIMIGIHDTFSPESHVY